MQGMKYQAVHAGIDSQSKSAAFVAHLNSFKSQGCSKP